MPHDSHCLYIKTTFELLKIKTVTSLQHVLNVPTIIEEVQQVQCLFCVKGSLLHLQIFILQSITLGIPRTMVVQLTGQLYYMISFTCMFHNVPHWANIISQDLPVYFLN